VTGIKPMAKDELQTKMTPDRTRAGLPVLTGPEVMPGPSATYIAYGKNWANVSNTPFRGYKSQNHEGGISSPLIAFWPKGISAKNDLRQESSHLIDLMATCVDLAGAEYPKEYKGNKIQAMEGRSLVPGFAKDRDDDRILMFEHYGRAAIRKGDWKLVRLGFKNVWELYHIPNDRVELNDLSKEKPEMAAKLKELWFKHAKRTKILPAPGRRK
jgi:arylsulfatase